MSEHEHDDHEHDAASHGSDPLPGVDPTALHAVVDQMAAALHSYVETAVGVRAEFGAHEADEDPRVLALESQVGTLNAQLYDLLHETLGVHADLTGMTWDEDEHDEEPSDQDVDTFHLGFVVGPPTGASDLTLDSVLDLVDAGGSELAHKLQESGFQVIEWGASRGAPMSFGDDEDGDDEG